MAEFYKFLDTYEVLIYILLALGGMFAFRWLWHSWNEWRISVYSLEKEFSARRFGRSVAISAIIVILFCLEFGIATFIIPGLPSEYFITTPTLDLISARQGTLSPEMMTQFAGSPLQTAVATASGCISNQIDISFPDAGDEIKGAVELTGTVNIPNFGFYKYEVAPVGSVNWATISASRSVVKDGSLGRWDTSTLTPGEYQLRLVVTDNQGQTLPPCVVPVKVVPNQ